MQKAAFLREEGGEGGRKREKANDDFHQQLPPEGREKGRSSLAAQSAQNRQNQPPIYRGENLAALNVAKTISVRPSPRSSVSWFGWRISPSLATDPRLKFMLRHEIEAQQTSQGVGFLTW